MKIQIQKFKYIGADLDKFKEIAKALNAEELVKTLSKLKEDVNLKISKEMFNSKIAELEKMKRNQSSGEVMNSDALLDSLEKLEMKINVFENRIANCDNKEKDDFSNIMHKFNELNDTINKMQIAIQNYQPIDEEAAPKETEPSIDSKVINAIQAKQNDQFKLFEGLKSDFLEIKSRLASRIQKLEEAMPKKVDREEFDNLKKYIMTLIDDNISNMPLKFADLIETKNALKILSKKINYILGLLSSNNSSDNATLFKKPAILFPKDIYIESFKNSGIASKLQNKTHKNITEIPKVNNLEFSSNYFTDNGMKRTFSNAKMKPQDPNVLFGSNIDYSQRPSTANNYLSSKDRPKKR